MSSTERALDDAVPDLVEAVDDAELEHQPSEITYDEQFYPARPRRLRPSARRVLRNIVRTALSARPTPPTRPT
jgi:hypothetical protein